MAIPERDTVYTTDDSNRSVYTRESSSTGWFVGIIVALALLAIGYLVFSANSGPATNGATTVDVNNTPAVTSPADNPAAAPMQAAPAATDAARMTPAPAAPANDNATPAAPADTAPAAPAAAQ